MGDTNPFSGPHNKVQVPDKYVGLIIGKNGENLRMIASRSGTRIFVPQKNNNPGSDERTIEVDGDATSVEICKQEIDGLINRVRQILLNLCLVCDIIGTNGFLKESLWKWRGCL